MSNPNSIDSVSSESEVKNSPKRKLTPEEIQSQANQNKTARFRIEKKEKDETNQERLEELQSAASKVQREIEQSWSIDPEVRQERWDITVELAEEEDFYVSSYGVQTRIKFIDYDTISIIWWRWNDLKVNIDVMQWMEQIIKIINLINMVMKTSARKDEVFYDQRETKSIYMKGILIDTTLVSRFTIKKLPIDPVHLTNYINERKYAIKIERERREAKK